MKSALCKFAFDERRVSGYIYRRLLGLNVKKVDFRPKLPESFEFDVPGFPIKLNKSQVCL